MLIALVGLVSVPAGCGNSEVPSPSTTDTTSREAQRPASSADRARYVERAEAICRKALGETHALGHELSKVLSNADSPQKGITNGLVRPGTEILSHEAAELRSLKPTPNSRALETYLGLFEPIVELARQRLEAGDAEELEQARTLELMIATLEDEQSAAARQFGFHACGVGFTRALGGLG